MNSFRNLFSDKSLFLKRCVNFAFDFIDKVNIITVRGTLRKHVAISVLENN